MDARNQTADWLELSGLPNELNAGRQGAWIVFKTLAELDARRNQTPDTVQISLGELGERCGLEWEKVVKIAEFLAKKKRIGCFIPDNAEEPGLFRIRAPIETPRSPAEVAAAAPDPYLRDAGTYRYLVAPERDDQLDKKTQKVVDLYLNLLSQNVNSFIVDQLEILARRFPLEDIEKMMRRAEKAEVRQLGWVMKELVREQSQKDPERRTDPDAA